MTETTTYTTHFDLTAWARGDGGYRWTCACCREQGTAETAHAAEVVAQAHADVHGVAAVGRGW